MAITLAQNFYKETVSIAWTTGAGNFYVSTKPTTSSGYLVLSPSNSSLREIVKFTATGTDGSGDYVTVAAADRGLGGTTEQSHAVGESVYMNVTAEHLQEISDALDELVVAGAQYSDNDTIGLVRLSADPAVSLGTATITIASPAVITLNSHGLVAGDAVKFTTTDTLPTGITASTKYYVIATGLTTNTFQISADVGGTAVNTSGSQAGTHTLYRATGVAVSTNDTIQLPTTDEKAAMAGGGDLGTPSTTNKFMTEDASAPNKASVNAGETINGATLPVPVYQNKTDNEVYACDANDNTKYKFIGFAISNSTDGNAITLQTNGIVSGFTGLAEGEKYYVQDTAGTIGTTPGTFEILVGVAISTTEILIQKGRRFTSGTATFSSTADQAITTGFRPSVVRVFANADRAGTGSTNITSQGGWTVAGGNSCISASVENAGNANSVINGSAAWDTTRTDNDTSLGSIGTISTITDTGFTLDISTYAGTTLIYWEAEGEL